MFTHLPFIKNRPTTLQDIWRQAAKHVYLLTLHLYLDMLLWLATCDVRNALYLNVCARKSANSNRCSHVRSLVVFAVFVDDIGERQIDE